MSLLEPQSRRPPIAISDDLRETFTALWNEGKTYEQIQDAFDLTFDQVKNLRYRFGLPSRIPGAGIWTIERVALLTRLWADGYSASQIASELGGEISRSAVIGKVHRLGLAGRASPLKPELTDAERITRHRQRRTEYARRARDRQERKVVQRRRIAPTPPPEPVVWAGSLNIPLLELESGQCRYAYSLASPFLFCGQPTPPGQSWCAHCANLVFNRFVPARVSDEPDAGGGG